MTKIFSALILLLSIVGAQAAITPTCGGVDDTTALQNAITLAVATGDEMTPPPGTCKTKSTLNIVGRVKIRGVGFQGDQAGGFNGHTITQTSGFSGSVILCDLTSDCLAATTDYSVQVHDVQITYVPSSSTGTGLSIKSLPGAGHGNTQSFIQNVMVTGGGIGILLENCLNYHVSRNHLLYQATHGMVVNSPNWPNYQQAFIDHNEFWGAGNAGYQSYLTVQYGGDLIIVGNKGSGGGPNTNGLALFGGASGVQYMEPMIVVANSLEGPQNCITINTGNPGFYIGNIVVTGNQLWGGGRALLVNGFSGRLYALSMVFNSNHISVNGGSGKVAVEVDGVDTAGFVGNVFGLANGGSASTAWVLGVHTRKINVQSNTYGDGYTTKVLDLGTGNTIGGGSP